MGVPVWKRLQGDVKLINYREERCAYHDHDGVVEMARFEAAGHEVDVTHDSGAFKARIDDRYEVHGMTFDNVLDFFAALFSFFGGE